MQLYALNEKGETLFATTGKRGVDYSCRECGTKVRVRFGEKRRPHFFHLSAERFCRENKKSEEHIEAQYFLFKYFKEKGVDVELEKKFAFGRIADVYIPQEKLVFEIQCSLFSLEEGRKRTEDYLKNGFKIIWILHTKSFLKFKCLAFEAYLFSSPHYFTDIDKEGRGGIFDYWSFIDKGCRVSFSEKFFLKEFFPKEIVSLKEESASHILALRQKKWPYFLEGDFLYRDIVEKELFLEERKKEKDFFEKKAFLEKVSLKERLKKMGALGLQYLREALIESL